MTLIGVNRTRTPQPIRVEQFEPLGRYGDAEYFRSSGGKIYGAFDGRADSTDAWSLADDEILISEPKFIEADGRKLEMGLSYRRAFPIPADTFAALVESKKVPRALKENAKPLIVVDALDGFSLFGPRPDRGIQMPPSSMAWSSLLVEGDPPADDDPIRRGYVPGRPAARGHDAIVERIAERGVVLVTSRTGAVTYLTRGGDLLEPDRLAITRAMPVVLRKPCAFDHKDKAPEAWTVAEPCHDPICKPHMFGELRL
jgi:hypothetical protein